jgi:hypothetical protein
MTEPPLLSAACEQGDHEACVWALCQCWHHQKQDSHEEVAEAATGDN